MCVYLIIRKGSVTHTDSVVAKVNIDIEDLAYGGKLERSRGDGNRL